MTRIRRTRYAVVGLGYIAQVAVLPAFAHARRNSPLHAHRQRRSSRSSRSGDQYSASACGYEDYDRVLQEVDAVYICTPNSEHEEYVVRAAQAGVHVLCEKPLAVTHEECSRMIAPAEAASSS